MGLFDRVADLPVRITDIDLDPHERETSSGFTRRTTTIEVHGGGGTGRGEDVTYETEEHDALLAHADAVSVSGEFTVESASAHLDGLDLFPAGAPDRDVFRHYRLWGFESAILDLALRQADTSLGEVVGRAYDPVRFVVSMRLGEPPSFDRVARWLDLDPDLEFKLDATAEWTSSLVDDLAATDSVRIIDLKGQYEGTVVDTTPDPGVYRLIVDGLPDALLEDPTVTDETRGILDEAARRVTWDAPIEAAAAIDGLPWEPAWLNVKPSRFGTVRRLLDFLDVCEDRGIQLYGGGQFELDVGRDQIQVLASLFYQEGPNDVAPSGYNAPEPAAGLPGSPIEPAAAPVGFRW